MRSSAKWKSSQLQDSRMEFRFSDLCDVCCILKPRKLCVMVLWVSTAMPRFQMHLTAGRQKTKLRFVGTELQNAGNQAQDSVNIFLNSKLDCFPYYHVIFSTTLHGRQCCCLFSNEDIDIQAHSVICLPLRPSR